MKVNVDDRVGEFDEVCALLRLPSVAVETFLKQLRMERKCSVQFLNTFFTKLNHKYLSSSLKTSIQKKTHEYLTRLQHCTDGRYTKLSMS